MEASVSQEGAQTTATPEGTSGEAPSQQVPDVVSQRLDEISGRFDQFQPLLEQALQPQQEQEQGEGEQQGYEDFVDPETGYVLDPQGLEQYMQERIQAGIQEGTSPLQQQIEQIQQHFTQQEFADLTAQFPQIADPGFQETFIPQVEQAAERYAKGDQQLAAQLATNPQFVADQYLAGLARQQAQQGVPAGDQGVHLEGGTGNPGPSESDARQEWLGSNQLGAQSGPFGKSLDQF